MNAEWLERERAMRNRANLLTIKRNAVGLTDAERNELSSIPHVLGLDSPPDATGGIVVLPRPAETEEEFERMAAQHQAQRENKS